MFVSRELKEIAHRQSGYFTARQAVDAGYTKALQSYHTKNGNWEKVDRALFRLRGYSDTVESRFVRWTLWATGQSAQRKVAVSHDSALFYYGLCKTPPDTLHLTVSSLKNRQNAQECMLHWELIDEKDLVRDHGFCLTTPKRTLLDMKPDLVMRRQWDETVWLACTQNLLTPVEAGELASESFVRRLNGLRQGTAAASQMASGRAHTHEDTAMLLTQGRQELAGMTGRINVSAARWRSSGRSFTLVEMLVVIAIIAVLAGMLMPALDKALQASRQSYCANTERQITMATMQYTENNSGWYPASTLDDGTVGKWTYCEAIFPYTGLSSPQPVWGLNQLAGRDSALMFSCPNEVLREAGTAYLSYSINASVDWNRSNYQDGVVFNSPSWWRNPAGTTFPASRTNMVPAPGDTFLLVDNCDPVNRWRYWSYNSSSAMSPMQGGSLRFSFVHGELNNNWAFCDGHVKAVNIYNSLGSGFNGDLATSNNKGIWSKTPGD